MMWIPDWAGPVAGVVAVVLGFAGVVIGHTLKARSHAADTDVEKLKVQKSAEQQMIDQLQEQAAAQQVQIEKYRSQSETRMTTQDARMERLETDLATVRHERDLYRDYSHELRSHIYDQLPPPPPPWPDGAPR